MAKIISKSSFCDCGRTCENLVFEKQDKLALYKDKQNPKVTCP